MGSTDADLMAIGRHCANEDCRQIDFLPFPCSRCGKVYCLEHRVCPCNEQNKDTVLVCPLCAQAVIAKPGEDVDLAFDRHTRTDCDPANYAKVHRKPRCPAAGCKEKLTSINSYTCKECGITVCLKHRLPTDHACPGKAAVAVAARSRLGLQSFRRLFSGGAAASGSGAAAAAAPRPQQQRQQQQQQPANGGKRPSVGQRAVAAASRTKDSVQSQMQQYRQRHGSGNSTRAANADVIGLTGSPAAVRTPAAAAAMGNETCTQCGARFDSVQQLIEHAEAAHSGGWASGQIGQQQQQQAGGGGSGGLERCPACGRSFTDPVDLVAHVEREHGAGGGNGDGTCVIC